MNRIKIIIILLLISIAYSEGYTQDLIYSQFNAMPLAINPAFAGNNACNYRVSAIGRSQWMGIENVKSYQSATFAGDMNIGNNYDDKLNLWGLGLIGSYDKSGKGSYTNLSLLANLAYHLRFGEDGTNFLSFGIQGGMAQRSITSDNLIFGDQINTYGQIYTGSAEAFASTTKWYPDVNFGSLITLNPSPNANIYIGASLFHITSPNISFTSDEFKLPTRYNVHAGGNFYWNGLFILPSTFYQYQQISNYNVGTYIGKTLVAGNEVKNPIIGYLGLWYKSSDAIAAAARVDMGSISLALSYDIHTGGVSKNIKMIGSPEFSINYIGCFSRNSKRTGCPSL